MANQHIEEAKKIANIEAIIEYIDWQITYETHVVTEARLTRGITNPEEYIADHTKYLLRAEEAKKWFLEQLNKDS